MTDNPKLPGFPRRSPATLERRAKITSAVCEMHRALSPLLEFLDSGASISMRFKIAGDELTVSIKPGKPNDEETQ